MGDLSKEELEARVRELEEELSHRESDITQFRSELVRANFKIEKLIESLSRDLKTMHQLQRALVPTEMPNIPGVDFSSKFIPSMISGGDYLDIFEHENKFRFGMIVSSATGYGLSALLLSVLLKLTGKMEARRGADPHKIMAQISDELKESYSEPGSDPNDEASVFYSLFDRRSFELNYSISGDIHAFVQVYASGEIVPLEQATGPIKKEFNEKFKSNKLSLNSRDRVIVCTPGVAEVQNLNGESFGREGIVKSIMSAQKMGAHELRNQIIFDMENYLNGQELQKDVTVLVLEVKDRVIKLAQN